MIANRIARSSSRTRSRRPLIARVCLMRIAAGKVIRSCRDLLLLVAAACMFASPMTAVAQDPCANFATFGPDTEFYVMFEYSYEYGIIDLEDDCPQDVETWTLVPYLVWWEATATFDAGASQFSLCNCTHWGGYVEGVAEDCNGEVYDFGDPIDIMYCPAYTGLDPDWTMFVPDAPFPRNINVGPYETTNTCQMAQWADIPFQYAFPDGVCPPGISGPGEGKKFCLRNEKCRITVIPTSFVSCAELTAEEYLEMIGFDSQAPGALDDFLEHVCCYVQAKSAACGELNLGLLILELLALHSDLFPDQTVTLEDLLAWIDCALPPEELILSEDQTEATGTQVGDGSSLSPCDPIFTATPVHAAYGYKYESIVDASIPLAGTAFSITRHYSSQPDYTGANLVGRNWTASPFWFIHEVEVGQAKVPWCNTPPVWDQVEYVEDNNTFHPAAATNLFMEPATLTIDSVDYSVWRHTEPGGWEVDYLASGGANVAAHEVGLIKQRRDTYGNTWTYHYTDFGSSPPVARLTSVDCRSSANPTYPDAQLRFLWNTSNQFGLDGTLVAIQAVRFLADGTPVQTHLVEYTYEADDDPSQMHSTELGTPGDLVQVVVRERIDGLDAEGHPVDRVRITQYRYHDSEITSRTSGDGRLTVLGENHQLKLIIQPEQIEAYAEEYGYTDVESAAAALLMMDDGDELGTSGSPKVIDLASKIIAYEESADKVSRQYVQAGCGCSGSSGESQRFEYSYHDPQQGQQNTTELREYVGGSTSVYRYHFYDWELLGGSLAPTPYLRQYALVEPGAGGDPDGRHWVTGYQYNSARQTTHVLLPSASASYTPGDGSNEVAYQPSSTDGLVYAYTYADDRVESQRVREGYDADVEEFTTIWDCDFDGARPWLVTALRRYRTTSGSPTADEIETSTFAYGFHQGDALEWLKMTVEAELASENGPSGTSGVYETAQLFDTIGNNTWSLDADGSLTRRVFDDSGNFQAAGKPYSVTRNSDTTGLPNGVNDKPTLSNNDWNGRNTDGGSLTTFYEYDVAGRIRSLTLPGGVSTYTYREMRPFPGRTTLDAYYATIILPATNGSEVSGPAAIRWFNADSQPIGGTDYEVIDIGNYDPATGAYSFGTQLSRNEVVHSISGLAESVLEWWDPGHSPEMSTFEYDALGRIQFATDANGTITGYHEYDVLDRVLEIRVGTDDQAMATVAQFFYDWDHTGNPAQGQGDGNLVLTRLYTGETVGSEPVVRETEQYFDYRNRPVKSIAPLPPHEIVVYDNLDRVTERALFQIEPTAIDQDLDDRGLYSTRSYSQRGFVYRDAVAIDPTLASPDFLESNRWFDPAGRPVVAWDPNTPIEKTDYDGLGRVKARYVTRDSDLYAYGPGRNGSPPIDNHGEVAGSVATDQVIEQVNYEYDRNGGSPPRGTLDMVSKYHRLHDAGGATGALSHTTAVPLYVGFYYDDFRRRIRTANFGVGDVYTSNVFEKGQQAPVSWPPSSVPDYDTYFWDNFIIEATSYDARGLVDTQTDSEGAQTRFGYDMMSRRVAVVENYDDTSGLNISWSGSLDRWVVTDVGDVADVNRTTTFVYDGAGNIRKQVAHLPETTDPNDSEVQETAYIYGVTTSGGSLLDSNSLLGAVHYPDESTGEAGASRAYQVLYQYNRLGELLSVEDQNETLHSYTRDALGRVTLDSVNLPQGSPIDDWVRSIGVEFDTFGRLHRVTSYSDPSGTAVVNQAELAYSSLWQATQIYQDYDGAVTYDGSGAPTGNTRRVQYAYSDADVDAGNYSRISTLTYPDGAVYNHSHGSSGDIDDHISRLTHMKISGDISDTVAYEHVGLGMLAAVDYPIADLQLDRTVSHDGKRRTQGYTTQTPGVYPGWDRFGRISKHAWVDGSYTTGTGGAPSLPPLIELDYTYDRTSNRLSMTDARPGATWVDRDFKFAYDGLDRLAQADRGADGGSWSAAVGGQKWALDMLGNWEAVWRDADGDGTYESTEDQLRTHNAANEIEDLTPVAGPPALPFEYDDAGNMAESPNHSGSATLYYTHDAWNRLTSTTSGTTPLGEYEYNALHWRTVKRARNPIVGGTGLDEMRLMYYSANWQLLEERIDRAWSGSGFSEDEKAQNFWGKRYIDDAVLRRRDRSVSAGYEDTFYYISDAQFSTVAMADANNGRIVERTTYDAYGKARHHFGGDVNNDNAASTADDTAIVATIAAGSNSIGQANYVVEQDLNRDGAINTSDRLVLQALTGNAAQAALPTGHVSFNSTGSGASLIHGPDNPIAWDGYVFNSETLQYTVRFRWYDPVLGRWLERDPLGYVANASLYNYCWDAPSSLLDPYGESPLSWLIKKLGKKLGTKGVKESIELLAKRIRRIASKCDTPEALELLEDVDDLLSIVNADDGLLIQIVEIIPIAGDAVGIYRLGDQAQRVYRKWQALLGKYKRFITNARARGTRRAWSREMDRARRGEKLSRDWTPEQVEALKRGEKPIDPKTGRCFEADHIKTVEECPELADDPDNIQFLTREEHLEKHKK